MTRALLAVVVLVKVTAAGYLAMTLPAPWGYVLGMGVGAWLALVHRWEVRG